MNPADIPPKDWFASSETIRRLLGLSGSPVALAFAHDKGAIPPGMEEISEQVRHCQMVNLARREGKVFFAPVDRHQCVGGAYALGLRPISESLRTGEFYFKLGKFASQAACKRTIDAIPHLETGMTYATMYAPLEKSPFVPQVVLIIADPRGMLKLAQSTLYTLGGRISSSFSGIQSVCADATAQTYLSGRANYSLGCDGSRKFSGIADNEMVMGFPAELLPEITRALVNVTSAPGSK